MVRILDLLGRLIDFLRRYAVTITGRPVSCLAMATTAGFHQATISAVERPVRIPGIDVLLGVCRPLAVTPDHCSGGRAPAGRG